MTDAVLLVHHGTVERLDDLPLFLRNVRRGHDAPPELAAEIRRRYEAIPRGGSPLNAIAARIAEKLEARLGLPVRAAGRLWHPYPREVIADAKKRIGVVALAQHSSSVYADAVRRDLPSAEILAAHNWGQTPALLDAFAARIRERASPTTKTALILSAHSLPKHADDLYEEQTRLAAHAVAERVRDVCAEAHVVFQSQGAGATPSSWLGPTLLETLDKLEEKRVIVAPIGFLIDHVEILYDIDIEAKAHAVTRGIELVRSRSLNDDDDFIAVLEPLARGLL
jgi:ferrochelatase